MPKNQLFRQVPPRDICQKVLESFGIKDLDDTINFSRKDLEAVQCVEKMERLRPLLVKYYLPCKARTYLNDLNEKNVITILRQIVRLYGYSISSREKYIKGDKFIIYQLIPTEKRKYQPITVSTFKQDEKSCVVTFD